MVNEIAHCRLGGASLLFCLLVFVLAVPFVHVLDDGTALDDANEDLLIVHNRDEALTVCCCYQLIHVLIDAYRIVCEMSGNVSQHDVFRSGESDVGRIFEPPEKITFCDNTFVFAVSGKNGQALVSMVLHLFHGLPKGHVTVKVFDLTLGREKHGDVQEETSLCIRLFDHGYHIVCLCPQYERHEGFLYPNIKITLHF